MKQMCRLLGVHDLTWDRLFVDQSEPPTNDQIALLRMFDHWAEEMEAMMGL